MIGRFVYKPEAMRDDIVLHMGWLGQKPVAQVIPPCWVVDMLKDHEVAAREDDEYMGLPMALSYGVLLAGLSGASLVVAGDRSAWPSEWGNLMEIHPIGMARAKSH